jgi:hypothetical protein
MAVQAVEPGPVALAVGRVAVQAVEPGPVALAVERVAVQAVEPGPVALAVERGRVAVPAVERAVAEPEVERVEGVEGRVAETDPPKRTSDFWQHATTSNATRGVLRLSQVAASVTPARRVKMFR